MTRASADMDNAVPNMSIIEFPSLRRSRRYGAKVRTGCITCKIRHIKCDERKPSCLRCTSAGRECDGYARDKIVPVQSHNLNQPSTFQYTMPMIPGFYEGIHYLEFYHHCAGPALSSKFHNEFWSRIVLQMAQSESAVRYALIALGYLYKTEPGDLKHARSFTADHQDKTLLVYYNKAVRCLIVRIAESSYVPEVGLVTCLLFICIELMRGNYHMAFTHLKSGLRVISEQQQGGVHGSLGSSLSLPSSPASSGGFSGPTPMIQDNLIPMFVTAIAPAILYGANIEQALEIPYPHPQSFIERPFMTILEAQSSSHKLRNPTLLFARTMATKQFLREPITAKDLQYQRHLLECHHVWFRALQVLEHKRRLSKEDKIIASSLKVGYYTCSTMLACAAEVSQKPYDAHISSFKAINHHAKIVIDSMNSPTVSSSSPPAIPSTSPPSCGDKTSTSSPKSSPRAGANFTLDVSLIPCLHFTAMRCRCPITRREAVSLLAMNLPREALWDPKQHVVVANRVIEIEESEVDPETGWPVERTRLWSAVIDGDMDRNGGFWVYFASANWILGNVAQDSRKRRRPDAEWEEWFVL